MKEQVKMKFGFIYACIAAIMVFTVFSLHASGANTDNGQTVLENYLEAIQNNDFEAAYTYLDNKSRREVSYSLFMRLCELNKSIREVTNYKISFKGYEETSNAISGTKQQVSVFTVDYSVKEKLAYSLPYISSSDYSLVSEEGEWLVVLARTCQQIEEEIGNYDIDQYEDTGKDTDSFINSLENEISIGMEKYGIEGCAVVLVEDNKIIFSKQYGYANVKSKTSVGPDTVFNIGSCSKTVSAWGALKIYEAGLFDLDSPAEVYMKRWNFPASDYDSGKITVRQLLEHRSGLAFSEERGYGGYPYGGVIPNIVESLRGDLYPQYAVRQVFESGKDYHYSGANYTVLQLIMEDVTGIPFEDYMQEEVFKPLNMHNSTFDVEKVINKKLATGYNNSGKSYQTYVSPEQAGGSLYCTADDLALFLITMNTTLSPVKGKPGFLSYQTVKPVLDVKTIDYKLGSFVYNSEIAPLLVQHQGHNQGYMALYAALPESGSGIVFLTNSDNGKAVMQPLADKWLRWKAGPAKPLFSTLKYTLQKSRDRAENTYILMVIIPAAVLSAVCIFIISGIIKGKRRLTTLYMLCYSKVNIVICVLTPSITAFWWCVVYDSLFDKISPFPETSFIDLAVAFLVTSLCSCIMLNLLFPKKN